MSDTKIPERSQQRQEDLWDLTDLYPSDEAWQADFDKLKELAAKVPEYGGALAVQPRRFWSMHGWMSKLVCFWTALPITHSGKTMRIPVWRHTRPWLPGSPLSG